jgi:selenocysteine-specific elongation factor
MELVLLVVAADEGVMPQTREHVAACELLGLRRAVVASRRSIGSARSWRARRGGGARAPRRGRWKAEVVLCSARTGQGIDALREAVKRGAPRACRPPPHGPRARLSVDRVFSVKGAGTVVTGTLVEGKIALGAPLCLAGETEVQATAARGLHIHDHAVTMAEAPTRLALNLANLSLDAVHRGDVVTDDESVRATRVIDVALRSDAVLRRGATVSLYVGTAHTSARVSPIGDPEPVDEAAGGGHATGAAPLRAPAPGTTDRGDRW